MNSIGRPRPLKGIDAGWAHSLPPSEVMADPLPTASAPARRVVVTSRVRPVASIGFVLAAVAVVFTACGRPSGPGVASVGSSTTATTQSSTSQNAQLARFGSCMRTHGEPQFQNPVASGNTVSFAVTPSLGIGTPRYAQAAAACRRHLPLGIQVPGMQQITQADEADYLKAVACIGTHGFPGFPDPTFAGGSVHIKVPKSIDENSPSFQRAVATCRRLIPAGLPYSG